MANATDDKLGSKARRRGLQAIKYVLLALFGTVTVHIVVKRTTVNVQTTIYENLEEDIVQAVSQQTQAAYSQVEIIGQRSEELRASLDAIQAGIDSLLAQPDHH